MVAGIEISLIEQEPRVDSRLIAKKMGVDHRVTYRLIGKFQKQFEEFGKVCFRNAPLASGQTQKFVALNEDQSVFLLTLTRNSPEAVPLKVQLTKAFARYRKARNVQAERRASLDWQQARQDGKLDRRVQTDTIRDFILYAQGQGSKNAHRYYESITKMENKALFLLTEAFPKPDNLRNVLDAFQLGHLRTADNVVIKALREGMDQGLFYKDIYALARDRVMQFSELVGRTPILALPAAQQPQASLI